MNIKRNRAVLRAWLLGGIAALTLAAAVPAGAASTPAVHTSAAVGKALNAALAAAQKNDWTAAQAALTEAKAVSGPTDVDLIEIDVMDSYIAVNVNDHARALADYKRILASPQFAVVLSAQDQANTLRNAMSFAGEAKDYPTAIAIGKQREANGGLDAAGNENLSVAYYFNKDYPNAVAYAQKSVDMAIAAGKTPDNNSLQILLSAQVGLKDQAAARKTLDTVLRYYPSPDDWGQEIDITMGSFKGLKDMQLLQLYRLRVLTAAKADASDFQAGADLAMKNGYPGEARSMLETGAARGVVNGGPAGALLTQARAKAAADEKTIAPTEAQAAKAANGQLDLVVAEQYYGYGRFTESAAAAKRAVTKGGTKDPEEAKMVLGMALAAGGSYADAMQAFSQVGGGPAQQRIAQVWQIYVQNKMAPPTAAAAPAPAPTKS